jgi:hypothetical protein
MDASDVQLQHELQRFTTQFADRVTQATEALEQSTSHKARAEALRKNLLYVSAAMEIATGQFPEVNLLDMVVFIHLSRSVLERHWVPELYGEDASELVEVFARSQEELSEVAARVLTTEQRALLKRIIDDWLAENPSQVRVEGIRLTHFAEAAGGAALRTTEAKGLLSSVTSATRTANQALLLSERGLFLLQRLPFLWRLQARIGAREMLGDTMTQLSVGPDAPIPRMARELRGLARRSVRYLGILAGGALVFGWLRSRARAGRTNTATKRFARW